jgi:hypothetical protein
MPAPQAIIGIRIEPRRNAEKAFRDATGQAGNSQVICYELTNQIDVHPHPAYGLDNEVGVAHGDGQYDDVTAGFLQLENRRVEIGVRCLVQRGGNDLHTHRLGLRRHAGSHFGAHAGILIHPTERLASTLLSEIPHRRARLVIV